MIASVTIQRWFRWLISFRIRHNVEVTSRSLTHLIIVRNLFSNLMFICRDFGHFKFRQSNLVLNKRWNLRSRIFAIDVKVIKSWEHLWGIICKRLLIRVLSILKVLFEFTECRISICYMISWTVALSFLLGTSTC